MLYTHLIEVLHMVLGQREGREGDREVVRDTGQETKYTMYVCVQHGSYIHVKSEAWLNL